MKNILLGLLLSSSIWGAGYFGGGSSSSSLSSSVTTSGDLSVCRYDGTTGSAVKDSALAVSNISGNNVTVAPLLSTTATSLSVSGGASSGTNVAGADLILRTGNSTGNANPGKISFYMSQVGTSGSAANTEFEAFRIYRQSGTTQGINFYFTGTDKKNNILLDADGYSMVTSYDQSTPGRVALVGLTQSGLVVGSNYLRISGTVASFGGVALRLDDVNFSCLSDGGCSIGGSASANRYLHLRQTGYRASSSKTVDLTSDNQSITVNDKSYVKLTSDNATATNRTMVLGDGAMDGQTLTLEWAEDNSTGSGELPDSGSNNTNLASTWTPNIGDTISLVWNSTDWIETGRSDN